MCCARGRPQRDSRRRRSDPKTELRGSVVTTLVGQERAWCPRVCDFFSQRTNRLPVQHQIASHLAFEVLQSLGPVLKSLLPNRAIRG